MSVSNVDAWVEYQPIVDARTGAVVGAEALVRGSVDGEVLSGARPVLRRLRHIHTYVLELVLSSVVADVKELDGLATGLSFVRVNVDRSDLTPLRAASLVADAVDALGDLGDRSLVLDLDCSIVTDGLVSVVEEMAASGARIALDVTAEGVRRRTAPALVPHVLRLPRREIGDLLRPEAHRTVTELALLRARRRGQRTVAEGVETTRQLAAVRRLGCELAQGHLFAPAMRIDRLAWFLARPQGRTLVRHAVDGPAGLDPR